MQIQKGSIIKSLACLPCRRLSLDTMFTWLFEDVHCTVRNFVYEECLFDAMFLGGFVQCWYYRYSLQKSCWTATGRQTGGHIPYPGQWADMGLHCVCLVGTSLQAFPGRRRRAREIPVLRRQSEGTRWPPQPDWLSPEISHLCCRPGVAHDAPGSSRATPWLSRASELSEEMKWDEVTRWLPQCNPCWARDRLLQQLSLLSLSTVLMWKYYFNFLNIFPISLD